MPSLLFRLGVKYSCRRKNKDVSVCPGSVDQFLQPKTHHECSKGERKNPQPGKSTAGTRMISTIAEDIVVPVHMMGNRGTTPAVVLFFSNPRLLSALYSTVVSAAL